MLFHVLLGLASLEPLDADQISVQQNGQIQVRHLGHLIFEGKVSSQSKWKSSVEIVQSPAQDVPLGYPHGPKTSEFVPAGRNKRSIVLRLDGPCTLDGTVIASKDSFGAATVDDSTKGILRNSFGNADNSLNTGVYDRSGDWFLRAAKGDKVEVHAKSADRYGLKASGEHLELWLDADYYRDHLGYFLWDNTKKLWTKPVAGWCSWMAYLQGINEKQMLDAAEFFSKNLKDYGYNIIQMDDGFQRVPQMKPEGFETTEKVSDLWSKANEKFPNGLASLAHAIKGKGLTPGIWLGLYLPLGMKNTEGYVTGLDGNPYRGPWVNYAVNGFVPKAVDEAYLQSLKEFKKQGWEYFKIDTLRHVLYDSYRKVPDYWTLRKEDPNEAFRALFTAVKATTGKDTYTMACWGALPELAGIPDGCRIGEDVGPDFASMQRSGKYIAQFNYLNNVLWRNDPDYMCFRMPVVQCQTWATLCALAGGHIMVSDPIETYDEPKVDILRKVGPPIFLRPQTLGQLEPDREIWTLNAKKFGESWTVAARIGWKQGFSKNVPLSTLGLTGDKYLAFDFWSSKFIGVVSGGFKFRALKEGECQVISLRPYLGHPQVLGTDRHIGQGAYELEDVKWSNGTLSGKMRCGPGKTYTLYVHVPEGYVAVDPPANYDEGYVVGKLTLKGGAEPVAWSLKFRKQ